MMPPCWIIARPNGAGKTTFALEYLPQVAGPVYFINADLIAAGLVGNVLERKRRLGHYAVIWQDGKPVRVGEDTLAPVPTP